MGVFQDLSSRFWDDSFWLPSNITWKDFKSDETTFIPQTSDLFIAFPVAISLLFLRYLWESYIAVPIGRLYKLREILPTKPAHNDVLEIAFKKFKKVLPRDFSHVEALAEEVGYSTRQVERWWRRRRVLGKPSEMTRFRETTWRFVYYFSIFYYGLWCLWDKAWLTDTKHCWYDYPRQHVGDEAWNYYILQTSFYISLSMSMALDVKRKDFWEMVVHHCATLLLLWFSWTVNMVRIGMLILVCHDAVDYWMEGAKLAKYMRYQTLCDVLFIIFTITWFVTRLVIYPVKLMWTCLVESVNITQFDRSVGIYFLLNSLLSILLVLHISWSILIGRLAINSLFTGTVEKDDRSASELDTESEDEAVCEPNSEAFQHKKTNGSSTASAANNNVHNEAVEGKKAQWGV